MADFHEETTHGPMDIHRQMVLFTLMSVGKSLFGEPMTKTELNQFADAIATIQAYLVKKVVQPYLFPYFFLTGQNRKHHKIRSKSIIPVPFFICQWLILIHSYDTL